MPGGIYTSYAGAVASQADVEVIANNVANASTVGFRRDQTQFDSILGASLPYVRAQSGQIDLTVGANRMTGNPLHAAISGKGFFVVDDADGNELLTRRGDFQLNSKGELVLPNGLKVRGSSGALAVPAGESAAILADGTLATSSGPVGKLRVVDVPNPETLTKVGESTLRSAETDDLDTVSLAPGFLEESNVNLAAEMVQLIRAQRTFESAITSMQINDELTEQVIQSAAK